MKKHFVTFLSPGTFVAEQTTKEIESWDVDAAVEMSKGITERYDARPYAFYFTTRERGPDDLDSKETQRSVRYFLSGQVYTLDELRVLNAECDRVLIANMESNGWNRVIETQTPWRWTQPLREGDVVLDIENENQKGEHS